MRSVIQTFHFIVEATEALSSRSPNWVEAALSLQDSSPDFYLVDFSALSQQQDAQVHLIIY